MSWRKLVYIYIIKFTSIGPPILTMHICLLCLLCPSVVYCILWRVLPLYKHTELYQEYRIIQSYTSSIILYRAIPVVSYYTEQYRSIILYRAIPGVSYYTELYQEYHTGCPGEPFPLCLWITAFYIITQWSYHAIYLKTDIKRNETSTQSLLTEQ